MKLRHHKYKLNILRRLSNKKGIWFHIAGIVAIIWFLIRVVPRPDRIRYPCQQMSVSIALGYIAFWSLLWGALFHGFAFWIRKVKYKAAVFAPLLLVIFLMLSTITTPIFAVTQNTLQTTISNWDPTPKEPIGTPRGINPGRVTWVWDPDATEKQLSGYWWKSENNNQDILDQMYSDGLQLLAGTNNDYAAWDQLFRYFNIKHDKCNIGYQPGEKIAIKINMNNGFYFPYNWESDDIDANPFVVKALLRQLVNVVGVPQEDITVYDASRKLMNWFYNRVYYEEYPASYPASPLVPEFPNVNFVDYAGGVPGRQKVVASNERIYFAFTFASCKYRTLPTCVTEADYLINMPIVKRHGGPWVTLAGKNLFGSWVEDVFSIHVYHVLGASIMGHPTPQTDLLAHEHIGGKTLLYVGDGTYGCRKGNTDISRFQMYPFNNDWMSSLFFSQDPVAVDSVMYDFLHAEGTGPSEAAQNYLHQSAEPPAGVYDPENDGVYLTESLGVHEHWDTTEDIFSSERYSGPSNNGIDYIPCGKEELEADAHGPYYGLINEPVQFTGSAIGGYRPYSWHWDFGDGNTSEEQNPTHTYTITGNHTVVLTVTDDIGNSSSDTIWAKIKESNNPPNPPTITGPMNGKVGTKYNYDFITTDPDMDEWVWYYIDWDDGNVMDWNGPWKPGIEVTYDHTWNAQGTYIIRAKAMDNYGGESDWGTLIVTMPVNQQRSQQSQSSLFLQFFQKIVKSKIK